jgi:hypothetical protein
MTKENDRQTKAIEELVAALTALRLELAVLNQKFIPVERIVYGIVGIILVSVLYAIIKGLSL